MTDQRPPAEEVDTTRAVFYAMSQRSELNEGTDAWGVRPALEIAADLVELDRSALKQHGIGLYYDDEVAELRAVRKAWSELSTYVVHRADTPCMSWVEGLLVDFRAGMTAAQMSEWDAKHTTEEGT